MQKHDQTTAAFYDENAAKYASRDRRLPKTRLDSFLAALPAGGSVLELGCGGGQDSAYMMARGFSVTPTDGSPELARQASARLGQVVDVLKFEELEAVESFDGIWAEACLLHVPRPAFGDVVRRIHRALRPGGRLHSSFKAGNGEGRDSFDRYYNYPTADWLGEAFSASGWASVSITSADGGGYDGLPTKWLFVDAIR